LCRGRDTQYLTDTPALCCGRDTQYLTDTPALCRGRDTQYLTDTPALCRGRDTPALCRGRDTPAFKKVFKTKNKFFEETQVRGIPSTTTGLRFSAPVKRKFFLLTGAEKLPSNIFFEKIHFISLQYY